MHIALTVHTHAYAEVLLGGTLSSSPDGLYCDGSMLLHVVVDGKSTVQIRFQTKVRIRNNTQFNFGAYFDSASREKTWIVPLSELTHIHLLL